MKKVFALCLILCMTLSLFAGCGKTPQGTTTPPSQEPTTPSTQSEPKPQTREFTDSAGRTVTIPYEVTKIAISGPLSQVYILPLAGDMLVGVSTRYAEGTELYLPKGVYDKPEIGQLYGGKGEMDLEALLAAAPDVVIDIGDAKSTIVEDMDSLTQQTGIPFVHVDATVATAPAAYRMLGELVGRKDKAEELATYCQSILDRTTAMMAKVDADGARKSILYCLGDTGTNVLAKGSFHAETVNTMADNLAVMSEVVSKGSGNESDLEQIMLWNPDVIVFAPDSIYDTVGTMDAWKSVGAIASGNYYKTPSGPYGWLSSPPSVQRYLGLLWLGELLYPEYADYDLQEEVTKYYKIFYGCDLTDEMYRNLMVGAMPAK